jgi:hypothetical protein
MRLLVNWENIIRLATSVHDGRFEGRVQLTCAIINIFSLRFFSGDARTPQVATKEDKRLRLPNTTSVDSKIGDAILPVGIELDWKDLMIAGIGRSVTGAQ